MSAAEVAFEMPLDLAQPARDTSVQVLVWHAMKLQPLQITVICSDSVWTSSPAQAAAAAAGHILMNIFRNLHVHANYQLMLNLQLKLQ